MSKNQLFSDECVFCTDKIWSVELLQVGFSIDYTTLK